MRNRETLGAPNVKDFQMMITGATDSQGGTIDYRKPSVESIAFMSVSNHQADSESNYSTLTPRVRQQPGIFEQASSAAASERDRFSSFNMSTVDGDDFEDIEGPMGIESKRTRSINKYGEITPQSEASRLRAKQRRPSKLSS